MANITKTEAQSFIPTFWAGKALGKLAGNLVLPKLISKDWLPTEFASVGDTANVPKRGALTVQDKSAGTDVTPQAPSATTIAVALNKHKVISVLVEDLPASEVNQDILGKGNDTAGGSNGGGYMDDAVKYIAEQIETDGLTAAYTGFTTNATQGVAGQNGSEALIASVRQALVDAKVPPEMVKYIIWSSKDVAALLQINKFTQAYSIGDDGTRLREASLGKVYGMQHLESQYVVKTGAAPVNTHCIAFAPDALVLAMRPLRTPPAGFGAMSTIVGGAVGSSTEGLGMRVTFAYDPRSMGVIATCDALYGWAILRNEFGVHVLT